MRMQTCKNLLVNLVKKVQVGNDQEMVQSERYPNP